MERSKKVITGMLFTVFLASTFGMYYVFGPMASQIMASSWDPEFNASLKWAWTCSAQYPESDQVMMTPVVADVDLKCNRIPEVIFSTFENSSTYRMDGKLRVVDGETGSAATFWNIPTDEVCPIASIAVADITGLGGTGPPDGIPEILAIEEDVQQDGFSDAVLCFDYTGRRLWTASPTANWISDSGGIAVADLTNSNSPGGPPDGVPEIIVGNYAFDNQGNTFGSWPGTPGTGLGLSAVADLNNDGRPEVVAGCTAYDNTGATFWDASGAPLNAPDGFPGIADFDLDGTPEVVLVAPSAGTVYLLNGLTGGLRDALWTTNNPVTIPGGDGGPPTIADFDDDGKLEVGVAGLDHYIVIEDNGAIRWSVVIDDSSSGCCSSSAFDFEGDGVEEIVYRDQDDLYIYDGSTGSEDFKVNCSSFTACELPVVADVDNDGHAEIIVSADNCVDGAQHGIYVYENDAFWKPARCIWNQHTYHITNINDGASVPVPEANNWQVFNNYRCQSIHRCVYPCLKTYVYKAKFECGWQREVIQPCTPCNVSQRIPVETLIKTHINVYNPNNFTVEVIKYFVLLWPEGNVTPVAPCHCESWAPWGGRTCHIHIDVLERKGFEIDCEDVVLWSLVCPDPTNPIPSLDCTPFFKGFVMIECTLPDWALPIEVVAVYNKESADMVDKIIYYTEHVICGHIDTPIGRFKLYEPYELAVRIPFEPDNITLPQLVKRELAAHATPIPPEIDDVDVEIVETKIYFDFVECVAKEIIVFKLRATDTMWEKFLDETWPELERPPDWRWPEWFWPDEIREMKEREKFCSPWQEVIVNPEQNIRDYMTSTLIDMGVPLEIVEEIMKPLRIIIVDIDCCEGVGTSIDVEYIEPEIIDP